jgi:hypothetical protein
VTILLLVVLLLVLAAGVTAAVVDLSKIGSRAFDRRRALRACRRGWDWAAFERELASYASQRGGQPPAGQPRS